MVTLLHRPLCLPRKTRGIFGNEVAHGKSVTHLCPGYLATITSAAEQAHIWGRVTSNIDLNFAREFLYLSPPLQGQTTKDWVLRDHFSRWCAVSQFQLIYLFVLIRGTYTIYRLGSIGTPPAVIPDSQLLTWTTTANGVTTRFAVNQGFTDAPSVAETPTVSSPPPPRAPHDCMPFSPQFCRDEMPGVGWGAIWPATARMAPVWCLCVTGRGWL